MKKYFIIDFDSTFIKTEGLDELAKICLKNHPNKEKIIKEIEKITKLGMEGKISFEKSLEKRIKLLTINKKNILKLINILKRKITSSIKRNKLFFKKFKDQIYIISGGFKEYVWPVVKSYFIKEENVFANNFIFNKEGKVIDYDKKNPLSKNNGKIIVVKNLNLKGEIYVIGDGYNDYLLKEVGLVKFFIAFTENVKRKSILKKADRVISNFDEFLYENNFLLSMSYQKNKKICL